MCSCEDRRNLIEAQSQVIDELIQEKESLEHDKGEITSLVVKLASSHARISDLEHALEREKAASVLSKEKERERIRNIVSLLQGYDCDEDVPLGRLVDRASVINAIEDNNA